MTDTTCQDCGRPLFTDEQPLGLCTPCRLTGLERFADLLVLGSIATNVRIPRAVRMSADDARRTRVA